MKKIFGGYTLLIIFINIVAFIGFSIFIKVNEPGTISALALQPAAILAGKNLWTFVTSMFMHAIFAHLFVNMISLFFIGSFVEKLIGRKRFIIFYFIAGIFAGLLFAVLTGLLGNVDVSTFAYKILGSPFSYAVGASGAIFGLGGLLAVLTPKLRVLVLFIIPMPMWIAMIFLIGILWLLSITAGLPIGNTAHLGGLLIGVGYGIYLRKKYPQKTKMIERYFSR